MEQENKIQEPIKKGRGWGLTSFTLGLISLTILFSPIKKLLGGLGFLIFLNISIYLPILIIIFGIIGLKKKENKLFSILGILLGLVYVFYILSVFLIIGKT